MNLVSEKYGIFEGVKNKVYKFCKSGKYGIFEGLNE